MRIFLLFLGLFYIQALWALPEGRSDVYLKGKYGSDSNDGSSPIYGVATFEKAKELLATDGTIWVCGIVEVATDLSGTPWSLADKGNARLRRADAAHNGGSAYTGLMFQVMAGGKCVLENVIIDGGAVISDGTNSGISAKNPVFKVSGELSLNMGAVIQNNYVIEENFGGGAIQVWSNGRLTLNENSIVQNNYHEISGGGIFSLSSGKITLNGGKISGNSSWDGGGICTLGPLNINSGEISENSAGNTGGGIQSAGTIELKEGSIRNNRVTTNENSYGEAYGGGGIAMSNSTAELIMSGGEIIGNQSAFCGGGIFMRNGIIKMSGGYIGKDGSNNGNVAIQGGGIYIEMGNVEMSGGHIEGNAVAPANNRQAGGGGVYNYDGSFILKNGSGSTELPAIAYNKAQLGGGIFNNGELHIEGGKIIGNEASQYGGGIINLYNAVISGGYIGGTETNQENVAVLGGGLMSYSGSLTFTGGTVTGNRATGANLYVKNASVTVGGNVNIPSGIYLPEGKTLLMNASLTNTLGIEGVGGTPSEGTAVVKAGTTADGNTYTPTDADVRKISFPPYWRTKLKDAEIVLTSSLAIVFTTNKITQMTPRARGSRDKKIYVDCGDGTATAYSLSSSSNGSAVGLTPIPGKEIKIYDPEEVLWGFICNGLEITSLDLTHATRLTDVSCYKNTGLTSTSLKLPEVKDRLQTLVAYNCGLTSLDLSAYTALKTVTVGGNPELSELILPTEKSILYSLSVNNTALKSLNLSEYPNLGVLECYGPSFNSLKLPTEKGKLNKLNIGNTSIKELDLRGYTNLKEVQASQCKVEHFDLTGCTLLSSFYADESETKTVNLAGCENLGKQYNSVSIDNSPYLTKANFQGCSAMIRLDCYTTPALDTLNLTGCTSLEILNADENGLDSLNVSECEKLRVLNCKNSSKLSSLTLPEVTDVLETLRCQSCALTKLELPEYSALTELKCENNRLLLDEIPVQQHSLNTFTYAPQAPYPIPRRIEPGVKVDLSRFADLTGLAGTPQTTTYIWKKQNGETVSAEGNYTTDGNGRFTFTGNQTDSIYCEITTGAYADFTADNIYRTTYTWMQGYTISFQDYTYGRIKVTAGENEIVSGAGVIAGKTVSVEVVPEAAWQLKEGSLKYNDTEIPLTEGKYTFTMPAENVILTAEFEPILHTVTYTQASNGMLRITAAGEEIASGTTWQQGTVLRLEALPDIAYETESLLLNGRPFTSGEEYILDTDIHIEVRFRLRDDLPAARPINVIEVRGNNNTFFKIMGRERYTSVRLKMYNLQGKMIYRNDFYMEDSYDMRDQPRGVYYYVIEGITVYGKKETLKGGIEIIK